jgi:antitoxin (DNA-binding transcriptional repressor) of toxin-antitoxin stability system
MLRVKVSELKNRLSHYLRLVRGGEEVEILDRDIPVGRIVHISRADTDVTQSSWIKEVQQLGIVVPPQESGFHPEFLSKDTIPPGEKGKPGVLDALLEERNAAL